SEEAVDGGWLEYCHARGIFDCLGEAEVMGEEVTFKMNGDDALALVDHFSAPSKSRNVTWSNFQMRGLTTSGAEISATLDQTRKSSGTLLSVGNTKFPATATMRFFLRLETGGMTLVSTKPAVFQGIVNSIAPSPGDSLALISGPVEFYEEGGNPDVKMATLNKSRVVYRRALPLEVEPAGNVKQ
ncbi:MAG TPA: hypothetical protein VEL74_07935, partial [Thermoanaerobaculia bacterium]|nr:hypothetical protein [Thermoanaerobaculia bacterium]